MRMLGSNFLVKCLKVLIISLSFPDYGDENDKSGKVKNTAIYPGSPHNLRVLQSPFQHERDFTIVRMIVQPMLTI